MRKTSQKQHEKDQTEKCMHQQSYVVFKYKRSINTESLDSIPIQSRKIVKLDPQISAIANDMKGVNKNLIANSKGEFNHDFMLDNLFAKLDLQGTKKIEKSKVQSSLYKQSYHQYFLRKVNLTEQKKILSYMELAQQSKKAYQKNNRQQKFNKIRLPSQSNQIQDIKRVHYKIVDIKKQNFVNFNGKLLQYENLQNQQAQIQEFYVLRKGKVQKEAYQKGLSLYLPQEVQYLIEQQNVNNDLEQPMEGDSEDSNMQDRSDYDYPEEDYHSQNSERSSQDLIQQKKSYCDQNENYFDQNQCWDQEQVYKQYLKRCQKKQQGDTELLYMYGLKKNKYDSSDDDE